MTTEMEKALWRRQKQPIIQSFIDERRKLVSAISGRGFLLAPGHLYFFETGLEIDTKQKLSEVSGKILSDAVDRDLKQAGLDSDLLYKTKIMAWELEKQTLLSDWDKEIAGIKQLQQMEEEELSQLAIEVSLRGVLLIEAKTAIELQMEELRRQLAAIEDGASDYEVQLVLKKIETAKRKLEVIPILQQILTIEQAIIEKEYQIVAREGELVASERVKTGYLGDLLGVQSKIAEKKERDLLPIMYDLVSVSRDLAEATLEELQFEVKIMAQKVIDAGIMVEKAEKQTLITESQVEAEVARLTLMDAKIALADAQRGYDLALRDLETKETLSMMETENQIHLSLMTQERGAQSTVINLKTEIASMELGQKVLSSSAITTNGIENIAGTAEAHYTAAVRSAETSAKAKVTANLTHLIG